MRASSMVHFFIPSSWGPLDNLIFYSSTSTIQLPLSVWLSISSIRQLFIIINIFDLFFMISGNIIAHDIAIFSFSFLTLGSMSVI